MAVPTITLVSPAKGRTGGGSLVSISGSGFRLPTTPPPDYELGTDGDFLRSVRVTIGGVEADDVRVLKPTLLTCRAPAGDPGVVDVVVSNLDDDGVLIGGETVTAAVAFSFTRPRIDALADQDLTRLTEVLVTFFRRWLFDNVAIMTSTDFDPETGDLTEYIEPAKLPQIILIGPTLTTNRFYSENEAQVDDTQAPAIVKIRREALVHDVGWTIMGVTDNYRQMINLMALVEQVFHKNKFISIARTAATPTDLVDFELDIAPGGSMKSTSRPNRHNLSSFSGDFLVRGFQSDDLPDFQDDSVIAIEAEIEQINVEPTQQVGQSFVIGAGPGDPGT